MCKVKLLKTPKCLWPIYIDMFAVKLMGFFGVFINCFPKIHRSVLPKITIDLFYFWNVYDVNLFGKFADPVRQPNRHILDILLARRHTLVAQNCWVSVRLHHWNLNTNIRLDHLKFCICHINEFVQELLDNISIFHYDA